MGLVSAKEVAKVIHLDKYGFLGTFVGWLLMVVTKITTINRFYNRNKRLYRHNVRSGFGQAFDVFLRYFEVDLVMIKYGIEEFGTRKVFIFIVKSIDGTNSSSYH